MKLILYLISQDTRILQKKSTESNDFDTSNIFS